MTMHGRRLMGMALLGVMASTIAMPAQRPSGTGRVSVLTISDALDPTLLDAFRDTTGIRVLSDGVATPDAVLSTLRVSKIPYDLVLMPLEALRSAVKANLLVSLDPANLPEAAHPDPILVNVVAAQDTGGLHAVPFDWFPTGLAVNATRLKSVDLDLGSGNGWDVITKPDALRRAASCGFGVPDRPRMLYATTLAAIGGDGRKPNALDRRRVFSILTQLRLAAKKAPEAGLVGAMAQGTLCVAILPATDAALAADRAHEAGNGTAVSFVLPAEGGLLSVDVLAIPANALNREGAVALLAFLLRPDISARVARFGHVASADISAPPPAAAFDRSVLPKLFVPDDDPSLDRAIEADWRRGADH